MRVRERRKEKKALAWRGVAGQKGERRRCSASDGGGGWWASRGQQHSTARAHIAQSPIKKEAGLPTTTASGLRSPVRARGTSLLSAPPHHLLRRSRTERTAVDPSQKEIFRKTANCVEEAPHRLKVPSPPLLCDQKVVISLFHSDRLLPKIIIVVQRLGYDLGSGRGQSLLLYIWTGGEGGKDLDTWKVVRGADARSHPVTPPLLRVQGNRFYHLGDKLPFGSAG
ncbi:hypothetical protein BJV74DRAFT_987089 [Russula compacta]|nr:hypothetical protein BJV74DRAFT_987089 [Russula compacta]